MSKYKILVLDIDGTLTNSKKEISQRNRDALIELQRRGVKIVLASGRPTFGIEPIANELEMNRFGGFILSFNGGKIINCQTGETVYELDLPADVVPEIHQAAKQSGLEIVSYRADCIVAENKDDFYVQKEVFLNRTTCFETKNFLRDIPCRVPKCLIVGDAERVANLERNLQPLKAKINLFRSEPFFLEFVPKGIDKAASLEKLNQHLGLTKDEMVACGDGFNDLSMIRYAGLGIAMSNAQDEIKAVADFVTLSNDEDGVAHAIGRFFQD